MSSIKERNQSKFTSASIVGLGLTEAILRIQAYIRVLVFWFLVNNINPENFNFIHAFRFNQRLIQSGFSHVLGVYSAPIEIVWRLGVASIFLLFS